jgi:hypothetical protein
MPYSCIEGETDRGGRRDGHRLPLLDHSSGEGCCDPPAGAEGLPPLCSSDITWPSSRGSPSGTSSPAWRYTSGSRCGSDGASLARRAYSRRGAYIQIRGKHQVLPPSRHGEDGPAGAGERRHLHGPPGGSLSEAPQVGKADLQRCKTL